MNLSKITITLLILLICENQFIYAKETDKSDAVILNNNYVEISNLLFAVEFMEGKANNHSVVLSLSIELSNNQDYSKFLTNVDSFKAQLAKYFAEAKADEIKTSDGVYQMKTEFKNIADNVFTTSPIKNIFITNIIVQ